MCILISKFHTITVKNYFKKVVLVKATLEIMAWIDPRYCNCRCDFSAFLPKLAKSLEKHYSQTDDYDVIIDNYNL